MALFDLPIAELRQYRRPPSVPADLDGFWAGTLAETRAAATPTAIEPHQTPLTGVRTYDVTFSGYAGQPIKAWLNVPAGATGDLPVVVEFIGYGGGRGSPLEWLLWPAAGFATLVMDTRGQGGGHRSGDTPDPGPDGSGPSVPGFLTRGVLDPAAYYYRRLFADAARAVEVAAELPGVDGGRLAVSGGSQGGALALAAGSLVPERVRAVVAGVPFLCDIRRAITITDGDPYAELVRFFKTHPDKAARALATVDYIDLTNLVPRATAPALFSVGLMDDICPPSTVFAAFNEYGGADKDIAVFDWAGHEGGRLHFAHRALEFVHGILA
ncbi:MAG TPA: alpha/beta fold hydrolase [Pilimelia sp.]|nr:alpha/beta fold hydrolase [Pilimelia sp.]